MPIKPASGTSVRAAVITSMVLSAVCVLVACGRSPGKDGNRVTLVLGGYTTPREAYGKGVIPAFQKHWKEKTAQDLKFQESYQGSGAQSRAIIGRFEADITALSLEGDIDKIADAGLITHDWRSKPNHGIVSTSIVVIAVRPGNPKGIDDWADLARPGLNVLTPDPKTSGGAQWNNQCDLRRGAERSRGRREGRQGCRAGIPEKRSSKRLDHGQRRARVDH